MITKDEIEVVAKVAGKEGAHEALLALGIDAKKPLETQADFVHLRWWRETMQAVTKAAIVALCLGFGGTLATLIAIGFKFSLRP